MSNEPGDRRRGTGAAVFSMVSGSIILDGRGQVLLFSFKAENGSGVISPEPP
jgi:hypothetical protein